MADRSILYRLRAALQGGYIGVAREMELLSSYVGILNGVNDTETALQRLDGTGVGAAIFTFSGSYAAQNSNISEWFGNRQLTRMRCISAGGLVPATFTLPGSTALGTAFDALVTAGLPEVIRFVIEYTGDSSSFLSIVPRSGGPQIGGTTSIPVRTGIAATVEITRTSGVISSYVFTAIGVIGGGANSAFDAVKLIDPSTQVWDASSSGTLPSTGVAKGNAYQVVNAPSDQSGRFGEVMQNGDWVVWQGETFTSWSATPHAWFVLPAHEVRRISALESGFLDTINPTPESGRNQVIRGANYADSVNEIRLKFYNTPGDYSASDLNNTGDVDEYVDASDQTAYLAIRLPGLQSALASVLPTLYVFSEDSNGNFLVLGNLSSDFRHLGDYTTESDYISTDLIHYGSNNTLRIYVGTVQERYNSSGLDIFEANLSTSLQQKVNRADPGGGTDSQRLASLESKMDALFPLTPDVSEILDLMSIFDDETTTETVVISQGYSRIADYRGDSTRYEQTGVTYDSSGTDVVRYTGLTTTLFRGFGFKVTAPSAKTLLYIFEGTERIPYIDMTAGGNYRVNNYSHSTVEGTPVNNQTHFMTRTSGVAQLEPGETNVSTFTVSDFPTDSTERSRTMQVDLDVYLNGSDSQAGHFVDITDVPVGLTAQARRTVDTSIYLGPVYQNRTVNVTFSYEFRVSGNDLLIDFKLVTAPSDVTIVMQDVAAYLSYTPASTTARTDNWLTFTGEGGDYTFTGENELLISFHPFTVNNAMDVVGVAVNSANEVSQLNDNTTLIPRNQFTQVEIPDDIDFRMFEADHYFRHADLANLITRRNTQWCYGLAEFRTVTDRKFTQPVDFTQGIVITASPNNTRVRIIADDTNTNNIRIGLQEE